MALLALKAPRAIKEMSVLKGYRVSRVLLVFKVRLVPKGIKGIKASKVFKDHRVS